MDPTQNKDSFDSFGPGGNNTGGPVGGQVASAAAPVGGEQGASVTNNGTITSNPMVSTGLDQMDMSSTNDVNSGFSQANFEALVGSDTGDIVVGDDSKKSKKGLVIGLIVIAVMIVVGLVVWGMVGKSDNGSGQTSSVTDLKSAFNSYANYVLLGKESVEDLSEEDLSRYTAYFESLELNSEKMANYTEIANRKYRTLVDWYSDDEYKQFDLPYLSDFFQRYPNTRLLTIEEISDLLKNSTSEGLKMLIEKKFSTDDDVSSIFSDYLEAAKNLNMLELEIIDKAKTEDCPLSTSLFNDCYTMGAEELQKVNESTTEYIEVENEVRSYAFSVLISMHNELYNVEADNNDIQNNENDFNNGENN